MLTHILVNVVSGSTAFETLSRVSRRQLPCEDVESLVEAASYLLNDRGLPQDISIFMDLLEFVLSTCSLVRSVHQSTPLSAIFCENRFLGEDEEALEKARESLVIQLSSLSGCPSAALQWPVTSPPFETMLNWINGSHFQIRICALVMLGNFAYQSEQIAANLIQGQYLGDRLAGLLKSEKNGLVLKTALGAVQRFAKNIQHRLLLGQSDILASIAPSWEQETNLPLQQAALSTTRHLLSGSLENVFRFMAEQASQKKSLLLSLLESFQDTEVSETRSDIAWTLERMWRSVYTNPDVRSIYNDGSMPSSLNATTTILLKETIPSVFQKNLGVLGSFLTVLTSGNKDHVVAATYTLTIMMTENMVYDAVYHTLCVGEGQAIFIATLKDAGNPKAQLNSQTLIQKLKSHFVSAGKNLHVLLLTHEGSKLSANGCFDEFGEVDRDHGAPRTKRGMILADNA